VTLADLLARADAEYAARDWRYGQALFNVLFDADPVLARELWGTQWDPFYRDDRVEGAVAWLADRLDP